MARRLFLAMLLFVGAFLPSASFAATSAAIGALNPGATVGVGMPVSFTIVPYGFTNPTYYLVDSFPGGVTTGNINYAGNFYWVPNKDDVGTHALTITVSDSTGATATILQSISVVEPTVSITTPSPAASVQYGNQISFTISSTGFWAPVYKVEDSFSGSSITSSNVYQSGAFYWTPIFGDVGVHRLTISARDYGGRYASVAQTLTVEGFPSVAAVGAPSIIGVGSTLSFSATTTNFISPAFTLTDLFYTGVATSTMTIKDGVVSWTPVYNDLGVHTFVLSASDSLGHQASTRVSVTVVPQGTAPLSAPTAPAVAPGTAATPTVPTKPAGPAFVFKTFLTVGSTGAEVTALQQRLIGLGLLSSTATGYFGPLTKKAVQLFQKSVGLEQVGYVGPGTRAALNK